MLTVRKPTPITLPNPEIVAPFLVNRSTTADSSPETDEFDNFILSPFYQIPLLIRTVPKVPVEMPPLSGFSDNPFETRDDVIRAAEALIRPLMQYMSPGKGRVRIPHSTGTHFDETAAQLEGFARPFWAIGALLMGRAGDMELIQPWLDGFEAGTDPESPDYWGPIKSFDQRMVEAEMISFALLASPRELLWGRLSQKAQQNLITWLSGLHGKDMPQANWLWFRVFANLALLKVCQVDTPALRQHLKEDLERLDEFYITDGWSGDGLWRSAELDLQEYETYKETGKATTVRSSRNACYYSGSFAIQFSQLLYTRFAGDMDPERTERYRQQARDFGRGFCRFFDKAGRYLSDSMTKY